MVKKLSEYGLGFNDGYEHFRKQLLIDLDARIAGAGFMTRGYFQQARDQVAAMSPHSTLPTERAND